MILFGVLHARANRVVLEYISIVLRIACWAPVVMLEVKGMRGELIHWEE